MRALKWIVGGLLALALVVFLVGYIYLASMDFNSLKPEIARAVKEGTGRELTIGGDIKLAVSLSPSLVVKDIGLANAPWGKRPMMLSVRNAEVEVALWPLFFDNRLEVNRLVLDKPDILLEIDKQGRSNLDMQPQKPSPQAKDDSAQKLKPEPQQAPVVKDAGGKELTLGFRKVLIKGGSLELDDKKDGRQVRLALDRLALDSEGPASQAKLELKGSVDGQKFEAKGEFKPAAVLTGQFGKPLSLSLGAEAFGMKLKLKGKVRELEKFADFDFDVELSSTGDAHWGKEKLKEGFSLKAGVKDTKPKVYKVSGLELKAGKTSLKGKLTADMSGKRPAIKAKVDADAMDLAPFMQTTKSKEATPAGKAKPAAGGKQASAPKPAAKASGEKRVFSREKLDLAALRGADLELRLKADKVLTGKLAMEDLGFNLDLQNGKMELKDFKAKMADGKLKIDGLLDASRPGTARAALDLEIEKLDLAKLFDELKMQRPLEGRLKSQVRLQGSGNSVAAIMAGLDGRLAVVVKDGKLHKKHLNLLGAELASGITGAFGNLLKNKQYTDMDCLVVGFDVKKGMAKTTAIAMQTSEMTMLGNGGINLKTEEIDLAFKPHPRKGLAGNPAGVTFSLGELVKPFKLGGNLAQPRLVLNKTEVAKTLGKTVLGVSTYGTAGLLLGLASMEGEIKELCKESALAAMEGKPYKPRYSEVKEVKKDSADGGGEKQPDNPAEALGKSVGGALKGLLGGD